MKIIIKLKDPLYVLLVVAFGYILIIYIYIYDLIITIG